MFSFRVLLPSLSIAMTVAAQSPSPSPGGRPGAAMAYDAANRQTVLFGGVATDESGRPTDLPGDLWAWNGSAWRRLAPADGVEPPGRTAANLVYDAVRHRLVLFGGRRRSPTGSVELLSDLWEWDGRVWRQLAPSPGLLHASTTFDSAHARTLMFGGLNEAGPSTKLQAWNGIAWTVLDSLGPPSGANPALALVTTVAPGGELIVVAEQSGNSDDSVATRTWSWDGTRWRGLELGPAITSLQAAAAGPDGTIYVYHVSGARITSPLLHVRSPSGSWTSLAFPGQPEPGRNIPAAAFDAGRGRFVLHGSFGGNRAETWEFDGRQWTRMSPPPRS